MPSLSSLLPASIFVAAGAGHDYERVLVLKIMISGYYFYLLLPLNKQNKVREGLKKKTQYFRLRLFDEKEVSAERLLRDR